MKKRIYLLSSLLMVALFTVSCEKDSLDDVMTTAEQTKNIKSSETESNDPTFDANSYFSKQSLRSISNDLLWDVNYEKGYLHTIDVSSGALWGWTDNTASYGNITAPIAYYLSKSDMPEAALAGFEAMYARTSVDVTDPSNFNTADLGIFIYAYNVTNDPKYLQIANDMAATWVDKYPSNGFPWRGVDTYWGYDSLNWMRGASFILHTNGIDPSLVTWANQSIAAYETAYTNYTTDTTHAIYLNVNSTVYNAGSFTPMDVATIEATNSAQLYAYARIGGTIEKHDLAEERGDFLFDFRGVTSLTAIELIYSLVR